MTKRIDYIIIALFFLDGNFKISYSLVSRYVYWTSWEWYTVLATFLTGVWLCADKYRLLVIGRGEVVQEGIKLVKLNKMVPFHEIEKIEFIGEKSLAYIHVAGENIQARMSAQEILKLPEFGLNQWSISKENVTISRGSEAEGFGFSYTPTGKYAKIKLLSNTFVVICFGLIFLVYFKIIAPESLFTVFILLLLLLSIDHYKEVVATMDGGGIKLRDENLLEHCMAFDEVEKVEKGLFRTKVSAKDGRVIYFPQALFLWTELIEKFAKLREK